MTHINDGYIGASAEVAFGTPVAVTKFFEFTSEGIEGTYENIESEGLRAGNRFLRSNRFVKNPKGANGDLEMEVLDEDLQFWLPYMFGSVTVGAVVDGLYPHTATIGNLDGKSFTLQSNRVGVTGADNIFTWPGGKVAEWEISNTVDELLKLTLTCDFSREIAGAGAGPLAKQTPTYTEGKLLSFVSGTVKLDGVIQPVDEVALKVTNGLKDDRYKIAGTSSKLEQIENEMRTAELSFKCDFTNLDTYVLMTTGAVVEVELQWLSPDGGSLTITMPAVRIDETANTKEGAGIIEQEVTAMALHPESGGSPITAIYKTVQA